MKRVTILLSLFPAVAWAHPGHHMFDSITGYVAHLLSEPDHVAMIVAVGFGAVWLLGGIKRRRSVRN